MEESRDVLVSPGERGFVRQEDNAKVAGPRRLPETAPVDHQDVLLEQQLLDEILVAVSQVEAGKGIKRASRLDL